MIDEIGRQPFAPLIGVAAEEIGPEIEHQGAVGFLGGGVFGAGWDQHIGAGWHGGEADGGQRRGGDQIFHGWSSLERGDAASFNPPVATLPQRREINREWR